MVTDIQKETSFIILSKELIIPHLHSNGFGMTELRDLSLLNFSNCLMAINYQIKGRCSSEKMVNVYCYLTSWSYLVGLSMAPIKIMRSLNTILKTVWENRFATTLKSHPCTTV